jgi:hypothetical protein
MIHSLKTIAKNRFLHPVRFEKYVRAHQTHHLADDGLTTWDVDAVVDAYKTHIGQQYELDRNFLIKQDAIERGKIL